MNSIDKADKYSIKIVDFIRSDLESLIIGDFNNAKLNQPVIKLISDAIQTTHTEGKSDDDRKYSVLDSCVLRAIHSKDQAPLMFLLFSTLYSEGIIESETVPDLTDFWKFYAWYRESSHIIDYASIDRAMQGLDVMMSNDGAAGSAEAQSNLIELYRLVYRTTGSRAVLHENIYRNRFVSLDVQHDIESSDMTYREIVSDNVELKLFYPICDEGEQNGQNGKDKDNDETDSPDIEMILRVCEAMQNMANTNKGAKEDAKGCAKNTAKLDLTIIMSKQKKMFSDDALLSTDSVNSGSTYPGRSVLVWRAEELYKVLIHELIHFHKFDFSINHQDYYALEAMLDDVVKYDGFDAINETYTESLAIVINTMIGSDSKNALRDERLFNMWQVAKICSQFGGNTIEDLLENKIEIIQTTSVRSYYVYKMFMLYDIDAFLEFVGDDLYIGDRLDEFGKLIISHYERIKKDTEYLKTMNNFVELSQKNSDAWIYKTGRMSVSNF